MADALVIFKPDSSHRLATRAAVWDWLSSERDWKIEGLGWFQPPRSLIEVHYDFLEGRPFFAWLVRFMSSLPLLVGRISASAATLEELRFELGETRIAESRPGSLRERYGIGGGVNVLHLSDSPESGAKETALWSDHVDLDRIEVEMAGGGGAPDHTWHLRSLAAQYAAGVHKDAAARAMGALLREESDLDAAGFDALVGVILGAFD
ncbi:MAG TPA: nucleoside-diphosphate kinase [Candidatus Acidoferrales bacterium]|nr:nucleoside-diphosphate kinase [Candidatus Acidoferrales bacterium]